MTHKSEELLEQLRAITQSVHQIQQLLMQENAFLKENEFEKFKALQEQKESLTSHYEQQFVAFKNLLRENQIKLSDLDPDLEAEITQIAQDFQHITDENFQRLQAKENANNFIVQQVIEAAKEKTSAKTYQPQSGNKNKEERNIPLVLNKEL